MAPKIDIETCITPGFNLIFCNGGAGGVECIIKAGFGNKTNRVLIEEDDLEKVYQAIGYVLGLSKLNKEM
ncbi:MAG: hypothetical protein JRJ39_00420 [Deltaproteobacteria bacterium]|nr:hypothetical protein [Deltaproteobacteria bacterium]MBW1845572.1 hypothetical protein [Deltaproteobacteria bacterium]MBW2180961.1 hypothetical protein [Deltaproteobacteria bacterium]